MLDTRKRWVETVHRRNVAGQQISYRTMGEGRPLVMLHGYGVSGAIWQRALPFLAAHYQLFLVDLPGHGRSRLRGNFQLREMAPLLADWLRALELPPVLLMGQSMGGAIALHLTAQAPELVERLVLVNSAGLPLHANLPTLVVRSARSVFQPGGGGYPLKLIRDVLPPRVRLLWQSAQEMMVSDFRSEIAEVKVPTLILWGERDVLLPVSLGHGLSQAMPHARFVRLPESGHRPMLTQPTVFSRVVLDFLGASSYSGEKVGLQQESEAEHSG